MHYITTRREIEMDHELTDAEVDAILADPVPFDSVLMS